MLVLHASYLEDALMLWGEKSADAAASRGSTARRRPRAGASTPAARNYPHDAGEELVAALEEHIPGFKLSARTGQAALAWLPTHGNTPTPSSPLVADPPAARGRLKLAPWTVTAYPLSLDKAVEFLSHCVGKRLLGPGVVLGPDVTCWSEALRFAGSLVTRQQYLPGLVRKGITFKAAWEPLWIGSEAAGLEDLAQLLPPVGRALSGPGATAAPEAPAVSLLKGFIGASVDYLVRSATGGSKSASRDRPRSSHFDSVHDAWFHGLRSPDNGIEGDQAELAQLEAQVRDWRRPIATAAAAPFRLCFRLEEPGQPYDLVPRGKQAPLDSWYLRYLIQPRADPSLLVSLSQAWSARSRGASLLRKHGGDAREYLLAALGQAAGISRRIATSLETARPAGCILDTLEAHQFLTEEAAVLDQAGFGVMLPAWWTGSGTKTKLTARARVNSPRLQGGGLALESLVQFQWEVALGGDTISLEELEALARLKAPLVQVRGQWVELDSAEIQQAIDFWKRHDGEAATLRDLIQLAVGAGEASAGLEVEEVTASGPIDELLSHLEGRAAFTDLASPESFCGTLRPYQQRGYSWLAFLRQWGLGACLADDMGLGKTIQTLALIQRDREVNETKPVLLVCPTSVVTNWQKEASRFTPDLPVLVHHGPGRKKGAAFQQAAQQHAVVICSYGLLPRDLNLLKQVAWSGVVLDEAQNIKNSETRQSRAARALSGDYRICLTGTPVENNVGDLWSIMEFLNPGFLGNQTVFKRNFFIPIQTRRDPAAAQRLQRITGPFILRRLKTDQSIIADLPEKQEMKLFCPLTREQASLYAAVLKDVEAALEEAEGIERRGLILGTLSKLKQVCNHPAQFLGDHSSIPERSGKLTRLEEMLEEIIAVGDRALIFSQFAEMGKILQQHLQARLGYEVLFLHGGVPRRQRDRMVERFEAEGDRLPIFILSLRAGGTGLNLTGANHVFHFDRWWNPAVENQATDRAFRIGQTRQVQVHKFICSGTLEEKIDEMIESKRAVAESVVGTGEGWLTELSNEELREIFALRRETVEV